VLQSDAIAGAGAIWTRRDTVDGEHDYGEKP